MANITIFWSTIEYLLPVSVRTGKLHEHSRLGMYCGPDLSVANKGSIILWNPKTLRFISQSTYRILPRNHVPYEWKPLDPGNFIRNKSDNNVDHRKIVSHNNDSNPLDENTDPKLPETSNMPVNNIDQHVKVTIPLPSNTSPSNIPSNTFEQHQPILEDLPKNNSETTEKDNNKDSINSEGEKEPIEILQDNAINANNITNTNTTNDTRHRGSWKDGPVRFRPTILSEGGLPAVDNRTDTGKNVVDTNKVISKVKSKHRNYDNPTLKQAMSREDWPLWEKAINDEYNQMYEDNIFQSVNKIEKGANIVGSMFTLSIKRDKTTGQIEKYKARLVALGNQQKPNSYKDVSSQTVRSASVKTLLAIQANTNAYSMVLDVKGAYLKSQIDDIKKEKLYLKLPDGNIVKLQKYLYGLKQAGLEWQLNVTRTLKQYGYLPTIDPMIFYKRIENNFIMMSLHVDDFYVISSSQKMLDKLYDILVNHYKEITKKSRNILT